MANLLTIPLKKSYEVDIQTPVRDYIQQHCAAHPNQFKDDIERWQKLRRDYVDGGIHMDRVDAALRYHAQLVCILAKLPTDHLLDQPRDTICPCVRLSECVAYNLE
ncbi:pH-response regulator protein palA/rim20 [Pleurotus ostreatus]|nr:pH-response regulator protein palA/rim20 [Pleurotus ostreatus]